MTVKSKVVYLINNYGCYETSSKHILLGDHRTGFCIQILICLSRSSLYGYHNVTFLVPHYPLNSKSIFPNVPVGHKENAKEHGVVDIFRNFNSLIRTFPLIFQTSYIWKIYIFKFSNKHVHLVRPSPLKKRFYICSSAILAAITGC